MNIIEVSIIVLTTGDIGKARTLERSFVSSAVNSLLRVQFVYVINRKDLSFPLDKTEILNRDTGDVIFIGNDRYFGSCEENLFRVRDFIDVLKPWVLVVGETDEINWDNFDAALRMATGNSLDALLLNIFNVINVQGKGETSLAAGQCLAGNSPQNAICHALFAGNVISSNIAFPALMSIYGPTDWFAFIGSHLFSKMALRGILKHSFTEHVYSFVYMQALYFCEGPKRYQLFMPETVRRVSDDFTTNKPAPKMTWLNEHRTVNGHSMIFGISNVYHLLQIEDKNLFMLIACSYCLHHVSVGDNTIGLARGHMLKILLGWLAEVVRDKFTGTSFYLNGFGSGRLDQDIWTIRRFLDRLAKSDILSNDGSGGLFIEKLKHASLCIGIFFDDVDKSSGILVNALDYFEQAKSLLDNDMLDRLHLASFEGFHSKHTR